MCIIYSTATYNSFLPDFFRILHCWLLCRRILLELSEGARLLIWSLVLIPRLSEGKKSEVFMHFISEILFITHFFINFIHLICFIHTIVTIPVKLYWICLIVETRIFVKIRVFRLTNMRIFAVNRIYMLAANFYRDLLTLSLAILD